MSINGFFSNCQEVSVSDEVKTEYIEASVMLFLKVDTLKIVVICPGLWQKNLQGV